jgi:uncharacterized protein (TIGR00725 family)
MSKVIALIGSGDSDVRLERMAEEVGRNIAEEGYTLVCGGLGGVMEASAKGCREAGGLTIGILPGADRGAANEYIDVVIPTGMGEARNALIVKAAVGIIAIGGAYGTLSELAFALKDAVPVVGIDTWDISDEIMTVAEASMAVQTLLDKLP